MNNTGFESTVLNGSFVSKHLMASFFWKWNFKHYKDILNEMTMEIMFIRPVYGWDIYKTGLRQVY